MYESGMNATKDFTGKVSCSRYSCLFTLPDTFDAISRDIDFNSPLFCSQLFFYGKKSYKTDFAVKYVITVE